MIRLYERRDLDQLLEVWAAASALAHPFLTDEFLASERANIASSYLDVAETWVFELDGQLVGFVALVGANEVGTIFVDPRRQRAGIGTALMNHARSLRGDLEVEVFVENPIGRAFYERCGFREIGRKHHERAGHELLRLRLDG